jgi:diguanylate cyclase (GGDEF)-like protein
MTKRRIGFGPKLTIDTQRLDDYGVEGSRHLLQLYLFGLVGMGFLAVFAALALANERYQLGLSLLGFLLVTALTLVYLRLSGNVVVASRAASLMLAVLALYLAASGGVAHTGPLWVYLVFALLLFLLGHIHGIVVTVILFVLIALFMLVPQLSPLVPRYDPTFAVRFLASLGATNLLVWAMEYSRDQAFRGVEHQRRELERVSRTDYLTGVSNRRDIIERVNAESSRFNRTDDPFSVLLLDIDHFKQVNDTHGHSIGDCVLKRLAGLLRSQVRRHDGIARWGGEEFLLLLPNTPLEDGRRVADLLRRSVETTSFPCNGNTLHITVSIGVAESERASDALALVDQADSRLYQAKAAGRNRVA